MLLIEIIQSFVRKIFFLVFEEVIRTLDLGLADGYSHTGRAAVTPSVKEISLGFDLLAAEDTIVLRVRDADVLPVRSLERLRRGSARQRAGPAAWREWCVARLGREDERPAELAVVLLLLRDWLTRELRTGELRDWLASEVRPGELRRRRSALLLALLSSLKITIIFPTIT